VTNKTEIAVFGGGCFWCTEAVFKMLKGVSSVLPGYSGGPPPAGGENPTYEEVSAGVTGHAEVIKIEYDPAQISYETLLTVFFATHDPTTLNKQGNDLGEQYRSIILYSTEKQKTEAQNFIKKLENQHLGVQHPSEADRPIITEIKPLDKFYPAEDYHKNYYAKNKNMPYCELVINPKLKKVQQKFAEMMKK